MTLKKLPYTAKAQTTGGRDNGASWTDDNRLGIKLSPLGAPGTGTNPEQLFAAGWSACFLSAIKLVTNKKNVGLPAIYAEGDLGTTRGVHGLAARLNVSLPRVDRQTARPPVDAAHQVCPYSRPTHGNIDVAVSVL
jgi:Ohr subfamily peroxiredoxin